ncbi:MAG TPA: hypothetical protein VL987_16790 [Cellvibrio sp.]|nr:hypothetical protein [Cellvibrio sp.]
MSFTKFLKPNPGSYIRALTVGSALYGAGQKMMEQHKGDTTHTDAQPPGEHDVFAQAQRHIQQRQETLQTLSPVTQFFKGFNPAQWEVPYQVKRATKVFQYATQTSNEDRRQDTIDASKQKVNEVAQELWDKPRETIDKLQKVKSVVQGVSREGVDKVEATLAQHTGMEAANLTRQLGANFMMGAPAALIPGIPGLIARGVMVAKTLGNAGRSINDIHRVTGKEDGVIMQTINRRLETHDNTKEKK